MKKIVFLLLLIFIIPTTTAQTSSEGLVVYGQCVGSIFDITSNQTIESSFYVRGKEGANVSILYESESIDVELSDTNFILESAKKIEVEFSLEEDLNETILDVSFEIRINPSQSDNESQTAESLKFITYFQVATEGYFLELQVIDQYSIPYVGIDVEIEKDGLIYRGKKTREDGKVRFVVARGNYTVRMIEDGETIHTQEIQVLRDRDEVIYLKRIRKNEPPTIDVLPIGIGLFVGYLIRYLQKEVDWKKMREKISKRC